jgi:DNA-binding transcriptional ArsR family regulator
MTSELPAEISTGDSRRDPNDLIATIGMLVGDPARCRMLLALTDGRSLPAGRLAYEAGVRPSTASSHLSKLAAAKLIDSEVRGRHRFYKLSGAATGELIEALEALATPVPIRSLRQGTQAHAMRRARTCYDHLAGRLGVDIMNALVRDGYIVVDKEATIKAAETRDGFIGHGKDVAYRITSSGRTFLADLGVDLGEVPDSLTYCVDWSEQKHHLSGRLGKAISARFFDAGWVQRSPHGRSLRITDPGNVVLAEHFGLNLER